MSSGIFLINSSTWSLSRKSAKIPLTFLLFSLFIAISTPSLVLPFIITLDPSVRKSLAVSKPIPLVEPDIKTFLSFKSKSARFDLEDGLSLSHALAQQHAIQRKAVS